MKVSRADLDGLLARIEAGKTTVEDANLLRAILQQIDGIVAALEALIDE